MYNYEPVAGAAQTKSFVGNSSGFQRYACTLRSKECLKQFAFFSVCARWCDCTVNRIINGRLDLVAANHFEFLPFILKPMYLSFINRFVLHSTQRLYLIV